MQVSDSDYMLRAVQVARGGAGWTNPNPLVGAVIVKDGRIIGEGCHERYGQAHAERNALASCSEDPSGATVYVTLEPCCHHGKQPPCTDALIDAGVKRVVVGSRDPNPIVAGKGNQALRESGIEVVEDVERDACDELNGVFFHYITGKRPLVVAKWAMTLDGKTATQTGDSRWVSSEASRRDVHELRHRLAAVMVGIGTALLDDPMLTARRDIASNQPLRVVVDSHARLPLDSKLVRSVSEAPLLLASALPQSYASLRALQERGVQTASLPGHDGRVDLPALVGYLGGLGIDSVLVEGGGELNASLFEQGLVDRICAYIAPKVCGGASAKTPVGGVGAALMRDAADYELDAMERTGDDIKLMLKRRVPDDVAEEGN